MNRRVKTFAARQVIELLRSGVSSRYLGTLFSYGREAALERVVRELKQVSAEGGVVSLVVKGNFGNGKTHFLNLVFQKAAEMSFAISFVPLSRETPFHKLERLYRRAVAGLTLPGYNQPGFAPLLAGLKPGSAEADDILNYAGRNLHPKLAAVLRNYLEGNGDAYNQHILLSDLAGDFVPNAQLKSIHRLNFGKALALPRFSAKENTFDYFRFLARLICARSYAGWVILFDEFEQLMYLGAQSRANAYLNAARFISPAYGLTGVYSVFAASSNLWSELIWKRKNSDFEIVPQKLTAKGREHDIPTVREVFTYFLKDSLFLDTLANFDIRRLLQAVRDHHAAAYGWPAPVDLDRFIDGLPLDRPLRTVIRAVVEYLDQQYLYDQRPEITVERPEEILPEEEAKEEGAEEEVAAAADEEENGAGDGRDEEERRSAGGAQEGGTFYEVAGDD